MSLRGAYNYILSQSEWLFNESVDDGVVHSNPSRRFCKIFYMLFVISFYLFYLNDFMIQKPRFLSLLNGSGKFSYLN